MINQYLKILLFVFVIILLISFSRLVAKQEGVETNADGIKTSRFILNCSYNANNGNSEFGKGNNGANLMFGYDFGMPDSYFIIDFGFLNYKPEEHNLTDYVVAAGVYNRLG
jgi:hypothetical protein